MRILLTNDDGIASDGLDAIYKELKKLGDVTIVAPCSEKSSVGHGITLAKPMYTKKVYKNKSFYGHSLSGTPADCIKFALKVILKQKPDLVVSGINPGPNEGCSVYYSGTVAGAREGALAGIPSMALSLATFVNPDYTYTAKVGAKIAKLSRTMDIPKGTFLNINVPSGHAKNISGMKITQQGMIPIHSHFQKDISPNLKEYFWLGGKMPNIKKDLANDIYALSQNFITITPIKCDATDYRFSDVLKNIKIF